MEFINSFINDLASDGYSHYFAAIIFLSFVALAIDILLYGWNVEEETE